MPEQLPPEQRTICLQPVWDGPYRYRCSLGTKGVCAYHGPHKPHPDDGRRCSALTDGYCTTHGIYLNPYRPLTFYSASDGTTGM